jgi:hypothetical protein
VVVGVGGMPRPAAGRQQLDVTRLDVAKVPWLVVIVSMLTAYQSLTASQATTRRKSQGIFLKW